MFIAVPRTGHFTTVRLQLAARNKIQTDNLHHHCPAERARKFSYKCQQTDYGTLAATRPGSTAPVSGR